jgi:hypothetical protein
VSRQKFATTETPDYEPAKKRCRDRKSQSESVSQKENTVLEMRAAATSRKSTIAAEKLLERCVTENLAWQKFYFF